MPVKDSLSPLLPKWSLLITWGVVVLWFSLVPSPPVPKSGILGWDKFQHAAAYGIFTLLAGWAFVTLPFSRERQWFLAGAVAVIFGALLEVAQGVFTATRTAEAGDLLADAIGAATVIFFVHFVYYRYRRRR